MIRKAKGNRSKTTGLSSHVQQRRNKKSRSLAPNSRKKMNGRSVRRADSRKAARLNNRLPANANSGGGVSVAGLCLFGLVVSASISGVHSLPIVKATPNVGATGDTTVFTGGSELRTTTQTYTEPYINIDNTTSNHTTPKPHKLEKIKKELLVRHKEFTNNNFNTTEGTHFEVIANATKSNEKEINEIKEDIKKVSSDLDVLYDQMKSKNSKNYCDTLKDKPESNIDSTSPRSMVDTSIMATGVGFGMIKSSGNCLFDSLASVARKQLTKCFAKTLGTGVFNQGINSCIEKVSDWGSDKISELAEISKKFKDNNNDMTDLIGNHLIDKINQFKDLMVDLMIKTKEGTAKLDESLRFVEEQFDKLANSFEMVVSEYEVFLNSTSSSIESYGDEVNNQAEDIASNVKENLEAISDKIISASGQKQNDTKGQIFEITVKKLDKLDPALKEVNNILDNAQEVSIELNSHIGEIDLIKLVETKDDAIEKGLGVLSYMNDFVSDVISTIETYMHIKEYGVLIGPCISLCLMFKEIYGTRKQKKIIIKNKELLMNNTAKLGEINNSIKEVQELKEQQKDKEQVANSTVIREDMSRFINLSVLSAEDLRRTLEESNKQVLDTFEEIDKRFTQLTAN
jgi:ElaB/YqjD/DUF883 family membrane-anchored ribosome-binding protein